MTEDFYKTLELERTATADEVQKAYYKLARKFHPDVNPNKKQAKQKFQEIQQAFETLSDPEKRKLYDRFGPSYEQYRHAGAGAAGPGGGAGAGGAGYDDIAEMLRQAASGGAGGGGNPFDFFSQFRSAQGRGRTAPPRGGRTGRSESTAPHAEISIPFKTSILGGSRDVRLEFPDGTERTIEVKIPAGIEDGKTLRVRNQAIHEDGSLGDLNLLIKVEAHRWFTRKGQDLIVRVPISASEAFEGCRIEIPAPHGAVMLTVPPGTSSGTKLRVRGHGVKAGKGTTDGDLLAEILIKIPKSVDADTLAKLKTLLEKYPLAPRGDFEW